MKRILNLLMLLIGAPVIANAQTVDNLMRSSGRIYVVVVVMLVIFIGLIAYLIRIDKKIGRLKNRGN